MPPPLAPPQGGPVGSLGSSGSTTHTTLLGRRLGPVRTSFDGGWQV
jgi:hypothetical protein